MLIKLAMCFQVLKECIKKYILKKDLKISNSIKKKTVSNCFNHLLGSESHHLCNSTSYYNLKL